MSQAIDSAPSPLLRRIGHQRRGTAVRGFQGGAVGVALLDFAAEGIITVRRSAGTGGRVRTLAVWIRDSSNPAQRVVGCIGIDGALWIGG